MFVRDFRLHGFSSRVQDFVQANSLLRVLVTRLTEASYDFKKVLARKLILGIQCPSEVQGQAVSLMKAARVARSNDGFD
jgi:hypothetical protein